MTDGDLDSGKKKPRKEVNTLAPITADVSSILHGDGSRRYDIRGHENDSSFVAAEAVSAHCL